MKILINCAYVVKLIPTEEQLRLFKQFGGSCRWLYNHLLDTDYQTLNDRGYHPINRKKKCRAITQLKSEYGWLKDPYVHSLQIVTDNLTKGWTNYYERRDEGWEKPTWKKKSKRSDSFSYKCNCYLEDNRIYLPKIGLIPFHNSYNLTSDTPIGKVVVRQKADGWYASIASERTIEVEPNGKTPIGIDLGITTLVTLSDGTKFENIRAFKKYQKKLAREQRKKDRRKLGGKNRQKQNDRIARTHQKIARVRSDYQHKISTYLAKNHSLILVENLNVEGMMANHCLAQSIGDCAWSQFIRMLEYKAKWYGSELRKVDRWFPSSKTCSGCGYKKTDLTLKDRTWTCPLCGARHDRDVNAAINILNEGSKVPVVSRKPRQTPVDDQGGLGNRKNSREQLVSLESTRL